MAKEFRSADRDQQFLIAPDIREWLSDDHLVYFVIDTIAALDLSVFRCRAKLGGVGRQGWDPTLLVTLLIYAYAKGQRSSRRIEALCETDVAYRVITGNRPPPDHTVIARFRANHEAAFKALFVEVLLLCTRAGMGNFGTVSIDGTKIAANASKKANRSEDALRAQIDRILAEAAEVDAAEDEQFGDRRGDELPEQFADPKTRKANIAAAWKELKAKQAQEQEANRVSAGAGIKHWQQRVRQAQARLDAAWMEADARWQAQQAGSRGLGRKAVRPDEHSTVRRLTARLEALQQRLAAAETKAAAPPSKTASTVVNVTDPDSALIPSTHGIVQGFNVQAAVTDDQLIVAVEVHDNPNDYASFVPMMTAAVEAAETVAQATGTKVRIGTVLADAGYCNEANVTADGPRRLIASSKRGKARSPSPWTPPAVAAMRRRMRHPANKQTYRRRAVTVEPVFGMLKDGIGLRRFARRGQTAALAELHLGGAVHNLLKLHRFATATG